MNEQDLKDLAILRSDIDAQKAAVKAFEEALLETNEYKIFQKEKDILSECKSREDELTAKIKTNALAAYKETEELYNRQMAKDGLPHGLAIRVNHSLKYDLNSVTEWAKENAKMLFKLDVKAFEKMATTTTVPGVEIVDEPSITIATDLSEYLS